MPTVAGPMREEPSFYDTLVNSVSMDTSIMLNLCFLIVIIIMAIVIIIQCKSKQSKENAIEIKEKVPKSTVTV